MVSNKQQIAGTGGGLNRTIVLNDLEEVVSSLLDFKTSAYGLPGIPTFGIDEPMENVEYLVDDDNTDKLYSNSSSSSSTKRRKTVQPNLLQQQIELQE